MVIDNFTSFDLQWLISDKPIGFLRMPQNSPAQVANDNDKAGQSGTDSKKIG